MKKSFFFCSILLLLVGMDLASAQQRAGDWELQFYGMYYQTVGQELSLGSGTIGGKIGPYISDHFQIGMGPSLTITTTTIEGESNTTTTFGSSFFLIYSFLTSGGKFVPYFGAQYFKADFAKSFDEDKGSAGLNVGFKYFFARKTALDFSMNYGWDLNPVEEGGERGGVLLFAFGLSFLL